ncbi:MAG: hypothetical protein MUE74_05545 [Bacteroidales bacterium]|jgi:hypothetical protein|nr:hypothetical protein [Bacteroidales bacterium]
MKRTLVWILALVITIVAAYYQRKTGPTYPKRITAEVNDTACNLRLVRSLGLDERPEVRLNIPDTSVKAVLWYKRFRTSDEYTAVHFVYRTYPVESFVMNRIFRMYSESGYYAAIPQQAPAGKLQYFIEITDSKGTQALLKETPVVIRFKGAVPGYILTPHILIMFIAMLFSTGAGLLALAKIPSFRKYGFWTLILLTAGGMILGPLVQKYAFGELWTGIPIGWDLTDNKTLIAFLFWVLAVVMNRNKARPGYTIIAAMILLIVYSVPHSLFGSELDYSTGIVIQGALLTFFFRIKKNS